MWPLSPLTAFVLLAAVVPSHCYLNRGFTQWFHWVGVYYGLTQWQFLERFQVLSGCSICLGWYASLVYEFFKHGRFCHPLYKNMPSSLMQYYMMDVGMNVDPELSAVKATSKTQQLDFESSQALSAMAVAHVLDLIAHPVLTLYFWRRHVARGGSLRQVFVWPVIISAYLYSRVWSLTHTKYNTGEFGLWYFGFDIYVMDSLDSWYPAYITEGCVYGFLVVWKVCEAIRTKPKKIVSLYDQPAPTIDPYETRPKLLLSASSVSVESRCT